MRAEHALDQDFRRAAGLLAPEQARLQHPRVVEHEQIAGAQEFRQIDERPIVEAPPGHVDDEQAAGRTLVQRLLRDQFGRQVVVEIGFLQTGAEG